MIEKKEDWVAEKLELVLFNKVSLNTNYICKAEIPYVVTGNRLANSRKLLGI